MKIFTLFIFVFMASCVAAKEASLIFHVGMKDDHSQIIGVTIDNKINPEKHHYYLTYILMDEECRPSSPITTEIKGLIIDQQSTVNIPVSSPFTYYRILNFFVYNDMGIPLPVSDDTWNVITSRDSEFIKSCKKIRNQKLL